MERTQISLKPQQADQLRRLARERGTSMAHLIRDAVDVVYGSAVALPTREELWDRAFRAVGAGSGEGAPVSEDHDRYLDESYSA
jgi:hypothetical protein